MTTDMTTIRPGRVCQQTRLVTQFLFSLLFLSLLAPAQVFALGFRIPNQDASAIARGNAFVATADNPSALYYNPAGITQLEGQNVQVGVLNYFGINTYYQSPLGSDSHTDFEDVPVPQLYYTYTPKDCPLSFGLGAYAPFGLGVEWPDNTGFRSLAIESRLQYLTLNPVIAWKALPSLSIAIGPNINYSKVKFNRGLATPTDMLEFEGDDFSFGFNAGILWQPHPQWSFGVNYRSAATMDYEGDTSYNPGISIPDAPTTGSVAFPQIISAGVSYRPTTNWNIEVNVDYTDWNTLNTVVLEGSSAIFGFDLPLQFDWQESWFVEIGATRTFENGWFVSGGYFYSSETVPSDTFSPAVPDTVLHVASFGVGHQGEKWRWAAAFQMIIGPEREISNSQPNPFTGESANGNYQLIVPALSLSVGRRF